MDNGADSYRRFLDGDEDGLVQIITDYRDGLILYLNGIVQNLHLAEDIAEETFVKLIVKRPKFRHDSAFKTWLYAIARNAAKDRLRRREAAVPLESCAELEAEFECFENAYLREERKITVHKAMDKLNGDYRQALYLTYFEGFSNSETAEIMKKSKRQTENLIYRAKQSLKSELEKEGFVYENL